MLTSLMMFFRDYTSPTSCANNTPVILLQECEMYLYRDGIDQSKLELHLFTHTYTTELWQQVR